MLQELFDAIGEKAIKANAPNLTEIDPRKTYIFRTPDGIIVTVPQAKPPKRGHLVGSVDAMANFAEHHKLGKDASCWASRTGVVLHPNDEQREDAVSIRLAYSKPMLSLVEWEKNPGAGLFTQKDLIRLLRVDFRNCLAEAGDIINIIQAVRWGESKGIESTVGKGKSSMGKSYQAEFVGLDNLPDFITFAVPVFAHGFVTVQRVECALEPKEETTVFKLSPTFGQIEAAIVCGEMAMIEALAAKMPEVPVYQGQP